MGDKKFKAIATVEAGIAHLREFAGSHGYNTVGYNYSILMDDGGKLSVHDRKSMPCYGELRPYAKGPDGNGPYEPNLLPEVQRKVHKPGDLYAPFPKGNPIAVAVPFNPPSDYKGWNAILEEVVFNPEVSPWRLALKEFELTRTEAGAINGIIITDTHINPTIMVNLFRNVYRHVGNSIKRYEKLKKWLSNQHAFILANLFANGYGDALTFVTSNDYQMFGPNPELKRILNGDPIDRTGGTFFDRYAYDRPKQDYQWDDGASDATINLKTLVSKELKINTSGYGGIPETNLEPIAKLFGKIVNA